MLEEKYVVDRIIRQKEVLQYLQRSFSADIVDTDICQTGNRVMRVLCFDKPPLVTTIWTKYGNIAKFGYNELYVDENTPLNMSNLCLYDFCRTRVIRDIKEYYECKAYVEKTNGTPRWSNHMYNRMCKLRRRIRKRTSICEKILTDCFAEACNYIIRIKGV